MTNPEVGPSRDTLLPLRQKGWLKSVVLALIGASAVFTVGMVHGQSSRISNPAVGVLSPNAPSGYSGSESCASCHAAEASAWAGSQHARAMQPATAASV